MTLSEQPRRALELANRLAPHHAESRIRRAGINCLALLEKILRWPASSAESSDVRYEADELVIDGREVMQAWETPIMAAMARAITRERGDILEIGYGLGISADLIVRSGCRSYTLLEPNPHVLERVRHWAARQTTPIEIVRGRWPEDAGAVGRYDGIFFDPYPQTWAERTDRYLFRELERLRDHLKPGGVLTYFGRYRRLVPAVHQRFLHATFSEVTIERVTNLSPPPDCQYWSATTMLCVSCRR